MTPKEYAISLGLAKPGRGRMSREAHEAIKKAKAEGMVFDDPKPVVNTKPRKESAKPVPVERPAQTQHVDDLIMKSDIDSLWTGVDSKGKRYTVNGRQVCKNSGYSVSYCRCAEHSVLVASMEHIVVKRK